MSDTFWALVCLALFVALFAFAHRDEWFSPGWTLPLRIALFAFAGPVLALAIIFGIGSVLTHLGGIG